jgi:hypothetical protein
MSSSSTPETGGANTVAGSGTEASSDPAVLVSVHGVAPAGVVTAIPSEPDPEPRPEPEAVGS